MIERATATNNRKKDASRSEAYRDRLKRKLASSRFAILIELRTFPDQKHIGTGMASKRDELFCGGR